MQWTTKKILFATTAFVAVLVIAVMVFLRMRFDIYATTNGYDPQYPSFCVVGYKYIVCNEGSTTQWQGFDTVMRIDGAHTKDNDIIYDVSYVYSDGKGERQGKMLITNNMIGNRVKVSGKDEWSYLSRSLLSFMFAPMLSFDEPVDGT